ncbi:hypothetical protein CCAX7_15550 [Capsulimonas corticalis]|uniref:Uncharacterized protein n=1 Tax=Capsulimonas corticalis TaxID=2219043 RepID=A0A402CZA0_9BACT|nr:hypothetical protein [Capsulimonas corticalis]BDI29504.1 hypothetical protein CCAX7_15550 [Capsulimonas corticalis]
MRSKFQKYTLAALAAVAAVAAANLTLSSTPPAHAEDISSLSSSQLQTLISSGASLQFDASRFSVAQLTNLVVSARNAGNQPTNLTLVNVGKFSSSDLMIVADAGKGHVTFILDK